MSVVAYQLRMYFSNLIYGSTQADRWPGAARMALRCLFCARRSRGNQPSGSTYHGSQQPTRNTITATICQHHHHRSEEHTSELQSLMRISYAVFSLKKKKTQTPKQNTHPK